MYLHDVFLSADAWEALDTDSRATFFSWLSLHFKMAIKKRVLFYGKEMEACLFALSVGG